MRIIIRLCLAGALLLLSQLSLDVQYSGANVDEENIFQDEQPVETEHELMADEETELTEEDSLEFEEQVEEVENELMIDEEEGLAEEDSLELEEQIDEVESEEITEEEEGPYDENLQEELEPNILQEEYIPAE